MGTEWWFLVVVMVRREEVGEGKECGVGGGWTPWCDEVEENRCEDCDGDTRQLHVGPKGSAPQ